MSRFTPTDEQREALRHFATGQSLVIEAGAGTGKTSTLTLLAESAPNRRGQYIAFNKSLVTDAGGKFPGTVSCNTAHSLAYQAVVKGRPLAQRLRDSSRMPSREIADRLQIRQIVTTNFAGETHRLAPGYLAGLCAKAVTNFCQSADPEITARHIPFIKGIDDPAGVPVKNYEVRDELLDPIRRLWADLQRPAGAFPFKHEHYLKMYHLSGPQIPVDYILFDEAQDANPVIADIVAQQADHAQLVYVGDSQQEIYAWTGAINALASLRTENRSYLTQSFRFGQRIADEANTVLDALRAPLRLTGNPAVASTVEQVFKPAAILTRTNSAGVQALIAYQADGVAAHLIGGSSDVMGFAKAAEELAETGYTSYPDLACFHDWPAVREYAEQDPNGEDLRLQVKLVDTYGPRTIIEALERMPSEDRAEVVISTAHKSKGREWATVQLAGDFPPMNPDKPSWSPESLRLLYVAVTRAKLTLDRNRVEMPGRDLDLI